MNEYMLIICNSLTCAHLCARAATRGYVVEGCVEAGETFLFTSDVQGPLLEEHVEFILEKGKGHSSWMAPRCISVPLGARWSFGGLTSFSRG
jgi:predicted metallo-beta-lactamase superfamily hydrolase